MPRKKKGFSNTNDPNSESGNVKKNNLKKSLVTGMNVPEIELSQWDESYLMMLAETAGQSDESQKVSEIAKTLLETRNLLTLRSDVQALSQRSQGGGNYSQESVSNLACYLYLGHQFNQIKKYTQAVLLNHDEKAVLNTLENVIIEFACSDEFELACNNLSTIFDVMRSLEYKIMTYLEMYHKIVEQNPLNDSGEEGDAKIGLVPIEEAKKISTYQVQSDFMRVVQMKISSILKKQRAQYLKEQGFVNNHSSTKSLVEFMHGYLNFLTRFGPQIDIELNQEGIGFICETLENSLTHKDILTQSSIIYWNLVKISKQQVTNIDFFGMLLHCLSTDKPQALFEKNVDVLKETVLQPGIVQMAKIRGFVLTMDKELNISEAMNREVSILDNSSTDVSNFANFILLNCEKNEGLQKLYSYHTLESLGSRIQRIDDNKWLQNVVKLVIKTFEYPLHSLSNVCESILKRILYLCNKEQISSILAIVHAMKSKHEVKSRFIALNLALEHLDLLSYLAEHPHAIREMIVHASEEILIGKYVLSFFEAFLRKLWLTLHGKEDLWYSYWVSDYLKALNSQDENVRQAACTHLTPIVIKINKTSLAYILQAYLEEYKSTEHKSIQTLESLLTLLRIARQNKMICIDDSTKDIRLEATAQHALSQLQPEGTPEFSILQSDLLKLILTQNWKMSLECFQIVAQENRYSNLCIDEEGNFSQVSKFEYQMCEIFIQNCVRTTFPEHRQHFMKAIKSFMMSVRTALTKDIKKYVSGEDEKSPDLVQLVEFLRRIIDHCSDNLYVDKPMETALPLFETLKIIQDYFGDFPHHIRVTNVLPELKLLSKENLLQSKELVLFLLNSFKSTWSLLRASAYDLLYHMPNEHSLFRDKDFVNSVMYETAMSYCNNPKAMVSEGAGLLLKLLFCKCLPKLSFITDGTERQMQLQFCYHILNEIKSRLTVFQHTLIVEGKTTSLIHGLLGFFKNLFASFKINNKDLDEQQFGEWRGFFKDLLKMCLDISNQCSQLLSNNRLDVDGTAGDLSVDCRGHPINSAGAADDAYGDYDNLILVGVWLAVKENGLTLYNILRWLELPIDENDDTKFITDEEITNLQESLLHMLFTFRHRGAIEKAAEIFSLLSNKLLCSNQVKYQKIPQDMLNKALERITQENHSTILRRSAGIPPTIIAILRAEPLSAQPILLNQTLEFLINLAKSSSDTNDSKIHALNIMRFIFQDSLLKHDIGKFITPAMILATENFQSDNWSIRNSALMCFTSLTKRMMNSNLQEQDLSAKKGLSIFDFVFRFKDLSDYFKSKLRDCLDQTKLGKEAKERSDMTIFSILLFISRLVPAFQFTDSTNVVTEEEGSEEQKTEEIKQLDQTREQSMNEYVNLIKAYSKSGTYFVRKISAQALLPIMRFDQYISEIEQCYDTINQKVELGKAHPLRQNEAHGLIIRINIFMHAYFKFRNFYHSISGRSNEEETDKRQHDQESILRCCLRVENNFDKACSTFNLVIVSLMIKTLRFVIKHNERLDGEQVHHLNTSYNQRLSNLLDGQILFTPDRQVFLKDITKTCISLQSHYGISDMQNIGKVLIDCLLNNTFLANNLDFMYKFSKSFFSKMKFAKSKESFPFLVDNIVNKVIPNILSFNDENYCKVLEYSTRITHRILKHMPSLVAEHQNKLSDHLDRIHNNFQVNSNLLTLYIKLNSLIFDIMDVSTISKMISKYAYADQKDIIRVATVKSLARILNKVDLVSHNINDLYRAVLLILHDENPDIRGYLLQSPGLAKFIPKASYAIQSQSLINNDSMPSMIVDLNEQAAAEAVVKWVIDYKQDSVEYLVENFIIQSLYREQQEKNFDDKIFFFEPPNKYCDLLWIKKVVFDQVKNKVSQSLSEKLKNSFEAIKVNSHPSVKEELMEAHLVFEQRAQKHMINLMLGNTSAQTVSSSFLLSLGKF